MKIRNLFKNIKAFLFRPPIAPSPKTLTKTHMDFGIKKKILAHRIIHVLPIWFNKKVGQSRKAGACADGVC